MRGIGILLAAALAGSAPCLAAGRPLAHVRFIAGGLTVQPPATRASRGHVHESLYPAYGVRTAAHQRASIGFDDDTVLHINQRTDIVLSSSRQTRVRRGEIAELGRPGGHEQVVTAMAVTSAIGTEFDVRIETGQSLYGASKFPAGTTTVSVVQGAVAVANARGRVAVTAGHWTHVEPGMAPTRPTKHNARRDVAWTRGLPGPGR